MVEHSKTVRGTFSNPGYSKATSKPPQLGDPTSLEREKFDSAGSASATTNSDSVNQKDGKELPRSKSVRVTLANASGPKVNRSMLGDPVSLKAETSNSNADVGPGGWGTKQEVLEGKSGAGSSKSKL